MESFPDDYKKQPIRVGFYDIEETIGKGNFAVVKMARHRITKSRVAIKIIDKSRLDQANLTKVYREVQIMKLMRHPNVLKLYQVMETKNMLYIVSEYASKGEMFAYINKHGKLSENEARKYFWQIISAVEYCHKHKVVHRDLKTENLLLDEHLNVKIADFGFSNYIKNDELLKTYCGSPPYAAPEIFEGKEYDGPAMDIWSLGVVLYVLVCAALPFDGENLHAVRDRVLEGRFRVPYFMSTELEDLIRKLLVKDPLQRYTIELIKQHPWMQVDHPHSKTVYYTTINTDSVNCVNGQLNLQVLHLMQSMKIDITKTKQSVEQDAYDHHSAIYYLLSERLRHHRTSYPEQSNVTTRIRRASCMADQVLVRNTNSQGMGTRLTNHVPRKSAHSTLQYALKELHLGEVKVPNDVSNNSVPGCVTEFMPPISYPSYTSRMTHVMATQKSIETVSEEGTPTHVPPPKPHQRGRRSAVDAMMQMNSRRHTYQGRNLEPAETLFVPANHPLLKQDSTERPEQNDDFANKLKIKIVEPTVPVTEQTSVSLMTLKHNESFLPLQTLGHKNETGFKDGRRSSDGVNDPFKQHLLHKSDNQILREYEELQRLIQGSFNAEEMEIQQQCHTQFMELNINNNLENNSNNSIMNCPISHEWGSSQNELMKTLQRRISQDMEISEMDLSWNGPGPCRRPASYRKISGGVSPIPAHIRKRRTAVIDSPLNGLENNGMDDIR